MPNTEDEDNLDACDIDFAAEAADEDEVELLPLFPQGADTPDLEAKAAEWRKVLADAEGS